jgi:hypothetical protein
MLVFPSCYVSVLCRLTFINVAGLFAGYEVFLKSGSSWTASTDCIPTVQLIPPTPRGNHQLSGKDISRGQWRQFEFKDTDAGLTGFQVSYAASLAGNFSQTLLAIAMCSSVTSCDCCCHDNPQLVQTRSWWCLRHEVLWQGARLE